MFSLKLTLDARDILDLCRDGGLKLATAESCTGGLITAILTSIAGSSDVVERGFVTYSNEAKTEMLAVPAAKIGEQGAVSEIVARAMAEGALSASRADIAVSVTGVAGPGGGSPEKPVGLVHIACARIGLPTLHQRYEFGDLGRDEIRIRTVHAALALVRQQIMGGRLLA
jgi:nicotinamide-nucleotide amidase